jgi:hypothetical protein
VPSAAKRSRGRHFQPREPAYFLKRPDAKTRMAKMTMNTAITSRMSLVIVI